MYRQNESDDPDAPIRATDDDASLARLSATQKKYLNDPFAALFIRRPHLQTPRPPLINIGTFVRSHAIDTLVNNFILLAHSRGLKSQVVSLGAGSDTRFWRLSSCHVGQHVAKYIELDFPEVTSKKAMAIRKNAQLSSLLGRPEDISLGNGGTNLHSPVYNLLACDLRLPPETSLAPLLATLSQSLPTLLLFECVLVYMTPGASSALIHWLVEHFSSADGHAPALGCIIYEMFGLEDSFGRVMKSNLQMRNISLPGAEPYPTATSLQSRLVAHGFTTSNAHTLRDIRAQYIDPAELARISKLELLDEVEELELVLDHYAITWGVKLCPAIPSSPRSPSSPSSSTSIETATPDNLPSYSATHEDWVQWGLTGQ